MCRVPFYLSCFVMVYAQRNAQEFHERSHIEEEIKNEDLQPAETHLPFYGSSGFGLGYGGGRSFSGGNFGGIRNNLGYLGAAGNLPFSHRGYGGGELDKNAYEKGHKNFNDGKYEKLHGQKGDEASQGENGFSQGKVGLKSSKGEGGYFSDQQGGKKVASDGKYYKGGQYFNDQGQNADEKKKKSNHKKGHVIKGFKKSHHKDENEKTEEYYDEANDEGGSLNVHGQGKKYGENSESVVKGGHDDGHFTAGQSKKQGEYDSSQFFKKDGGEEGKYGKKKYAGNDQLYGSKSGNDLESLKGHHESSKVFKHYPHYY